MCEMLTNLGSDVLLQRTVQVAHVQHGRVGLQLSRRVVIQQQLAFEVMNDTHHLQKQQWYND